MKAFNQAIVTVPTTLGLSTDAVQERVTQERLLPFLLNPNSYPHRPCGVRLVQTHSSFVFVVPPFVYKVKKPVNFGFLNFSTLEKRRHFCEREVTLNRRLSPKMYLGVVPISTRNGRFTFDEGEERLNPEPGTLSQRLPVPR
jgi:uncharacterized protein